MRTLTFYHIEDGQLIKDAVHEVGGGYGVNYNNHPKGAFYVIQDSETHEFTFEEMSNSVEELGEFTYKLTCDGVENYVHACEDAVTLLEIDPVTSHVRHLELKKKLESVDIHDLDMFMRVYGYNGIIDLYQRICGTKEGKNLENERHRLADKLRGDWYD